MTVCSVTYTPTGGTARTLNAYNVQLHDARDVVGDVATIQCEGLENVGKGDITVTLGPTSTRLTKNYSVSGHQYRHFPDETEISCRRDGIDYATLRSNFITLLKGSEPAGITSLANIANISAATLQIYAREAVISAETYREMVKALERLGLYVEGDELLVLTQTSGTLAVPEPTPGSFSITYPNEDESPRELGRSVVLSGVYSDFPDDTEITGTYARPGSDSSVTIDTGFKAGSQIKFNNLMPIEWIRRLNASARMEFTVDEGMHLIQTGQRINSHALPGDMNDVLDWGQSATGSEAWIVRSIDHRWVGGGIESSVNPNQGSWVATVTAVPTLTVATGQGALTPGNVIQ